MNFIRSNEKKQILEQLKTNFGIEKVPQLLIQSGKERIRGFSGSLSKDEIMELKEIARVEIIGLYMFRQEHDLRLSFDATQILKNEIKTNIIDINEEQVKLWMKGFDLEIPSPASPVIIRYKTDFLGCGKSNGIKIFNYVPKDRRVKKELR